MSFRLQAATSREDYPALLSQMAFPCVLRTRRRIGDFPWMLVASGWKVKGTVQGSLGVRRVFVDAKRRWRRVDGRVTCCVMVVGLIDLSRR